MNKLLLLLLPCSLMACESAEYPWPIISKVVEKEPVDWVSLSDNEPPDSIVFYAMDDHDNIWVGRWIDGVFYPIIVGCEWPLPELKIIYWSQICILDR